MSDRFTLFQSDRVPNVDPAYTHHRESKMKGDVRELIDSMYSDFQPYLGDSHFEDMIQTDFHAAAWQLYIGWTFLKYGSVPVVKASEAGPDVVLEDGTIIEAVIAKRGDGPDKPFSWGDERPSHESQYVKSYFPRAMAYPDPKIILRITNAISEKRRKYKKWIEDGVVRPTQPFIIAVNAGLIDEANDAFGGSYGARVAFALGEDVFEVPVNLETGEADVDAGKSRIQHKPIVNKASGADVESNLFLDTGCSEVAALLFSPHYIGNVPLLGVTKDLELIPNGFACSTVRKDLLNGVRRTWAEVDSAQGQYWIRTDPRTEDET